MYSNYHTWKDQPQPVQNRFRSISATACVQPVWRFGNNSYLWYGSRPDANDCKWSEPPLPGVKFNAIINLATNESDDEVANVRREEKGFNASRSLGIFELHRHAAEDAPCVPRDEESGNLRGRADISCRTSEFVPSNYLYLYGLYPAIHQRWDMDGGLWQKYLVLGMLFLERELFRPRDAAVNVVVHCGLGRDRSQAFVVFYLSARYILEHGGLGGFKNVDELWEAKLENVIILRTKFGNLKMWPVWARNCKAVLRNLLDQEKWRKQELSYVLPELQALTNAPSLLAHFGKDQAEVLGLRKLEGTLFPAIGGKRHTKGTWTLSRKFSRRTSR